MTVEEQVVDVWESLGETDLLSPYAADGVTLDLTTSGGSKILSALNSAQYAIATFRDEQQGRTVRFKTFYQEQYQQLTVVEGTCPQAGTTSVVYLAAGEQGEADNYYQGWLVENGGESRLVVASDSTTVTVARPFSAAPAASSDYLLTRRWVDVTMTGGVEDVLYVTDLTEDTDLEGGLEEDFFRETLTEVGNPSAWFRSGTRLYFDRAPDTSRYFLVQLYRLPSSLSALTDESELPVQFHRAMVVWVLGYWGFAREFEPANAYSAQRRFVEMMRHTMDEYELGSFRTDGPEVWVEVQ